MTKLRVKGWVSPADQQKRTNRYDKLLKQAKDTLSQAFLVLRPIIDTQLLKPALEVIDAGDEDESVFVEVGRVYRLHFKVRLFTQEVGRDGLAVYESFRYVIHLGNEKDAEERVLAQLVQAGMKCIRQILAAIVLARPDLPLLAVASTGNPARDELAEGPDPESELALADDLDEDF